MFLRMLYVCLPAIATAAAVRAAVAPTETHRATASPELAGIVVDISSAPIPEAEVSVVKPPGIGKGVLTSKEGRFVIRGVPTGAVSLQVRRLGYEARIVDLQLTDATRNAVEIVLKPVPEELEAMLISAEEKSALREFYEHKAQRSGYAKFFDQKDIKRRGARFPSDLFRSIPGVTLSASTFSGNLVRVRGCQPMLWLDGQRVPNSEVDEVVSPGDIAGLEFYSSMAGTPAPYLDRSTRACGTILVWTKNR
ncbi:MAG: carboxypeptidase regulatory-like domain-containing protein [Gemmatimonadaceae bacterium]|nr:carboxypeptidase regulatory-like domain-containing protein [Gemmatimonadaceae bacterium]